MRAILSHLISVRKSVPVIQLVYPIPIRPMGRNAVLTQHAPMLFPAEELHLW